MSGVDSGETYVERGQWMLSVTDDKAWLRLDAHGGGVTLAVTHGDLYDLRSLLDQVLDAEAPYCLRCRGAGVVPVWSGRAIGSCPSCKGTGKAGDNDSPSVVAPSNPDSRETRGEQ